MKLPSPSLTQHWFAPPKPRRVSGIAHAAKNRSTTPAVTGALGHKSSSLLERKARGALVFENGTVLEGWHFGADKSMQGQLVFSTNMTGYVESMTDPSYCGQILNFTYPLVGNYGVPAAERDAYGLHQSLESEHVWVNGILVESYSDAKYHWQATR